MKSTLKSICLIAALFSVVMSAQAEVTIKDAWIRATVPQQKATGAFMQIQSSNDVHIVEIQTTAAGIAEIHEMKTENNVMKMRAVTQLDLLAGKLVELKPGGFHVMLMDLKAQIKEGDIIPLTIIVEGKDKKREVIEVKAKARALNAAQSKM
ncbi:copper chaperone PCu(A)C [Undibacterium sp. RTI2.1]|uniref:copper chaperone PCu(A)C n=1 Tax=unclassified Undibacterium TaxID=2630295 RepID=UPI002AB4BEDF|nr:MULTISPECIES: copper chaperone PCu(A)C [unclassified Undibacterium]MDY7536852.1 copper chaperone PCu(A)C [Undibacterium sp. 5I1]MEB0029483.1 copper chaperone PCu(A)C [Undibacterium sp. RTI2.1]MEB0115669.1 copper chaperone PCu(A)C [Undibacterium sp. RTI2.2]MEB0232008.1 copper chaperone PCu(A)C [Undibacterium sp. 10I3]MEB0256734.1 copper chaperone PCu(A)C [Undibacterium sp. 5I1]